MRISLAERLWKRVNRSSPDKCWEWIGFKRTEGYGMMWCNSSKRMEATHRIAWMITYGPIPDGICILHKCDNPPCCNPLHLFSGTRKDNNLDKVKKGRQPEGLKGENNVMSKLMNDQVLSIRSIYSQKMATQRQLAKKFGVQQTTIFRIVNNQMWTHL